MKINKESITKTYKGVCDFCKKESDKLLNFHIIQYINDCCDENSKSN